MHLGYIISFIFLFFSASLSAQIYEDAERVSELASENGSAILLVFSGSDWCQPCIRFKKEVLNDSTFLSFADNNLVIFNADFPQRKKQPAPLIKQNEELAAEFNPLGYFPQIVLLDKDFNVLAEIPYAKQSASEFIAQVKSITPGVRLNEYKKRIPAMGSFFEFILVDSLSNENQVWETIGLCIDEVNRIERLISEWINASEVSMINENAGIKPVKVNTELYQLIERSIQIGHLTQGAFDITFHALDGLWKFDGSQTKPPDSTSILQALNLIGYKKIQMLDSNFVFLPAKGMSIGFGGIGQGYAVDKVCDLLRKKGYENFVVNSSGDVYASGYRADGKPWKVGVANPFNKKEIIRWLEVKNKAVVTSGNYEKYFEYKGDRFAHIINPKTGWPTRGIVSATVISPFTEIADAFATSVFVLGIDLSLDLINQLPETHCIIIDDKNNVYYSQELIID